MTSRRPYAPRYETELDRDIAAELGLDRRTVSAVLRGGRRSRALYVRLVADALDRRGLHGEASDVLARHGVAAWMPA